MCVVIVLLTGNAHAQIQLPRPLIVSGCRRVNKERSGDWRCGPLLQPKSERDLFAAVRSSALKTKCCTTQVFIPYVYVRELRSQIFRSRSVNSAHHRQTNSCLQFCADGVCINYHFTD